MSPRNSAPTSTPRHVSSFAVFSFVCQLSTCHCPHLLLLRRCCWAPNAGQQSIGISCPSGAQQQTRRTLLRRSIDGTDRRADGRTPVCYIDLVPHTMRQCQRYQFPCCKGVQVQYPMRNVGGVLTAHLPPLRREPVGGL